MEVIKNFKYEESAYTEALFHLFLYHQANSSLALKKLKHLIKNITPESRRKIEDTIKKELEKMGLKENEESRIITPAEFKTAAHNTNPILRAP